MGSEEGEPRARPRLPSCLMNIHTFLGEAVFLERSKNTALHVSFFEQRIKAGLVCQNAQVTKHEHRSREGKGSSGRASQKQQFG